MGTIVLIRYSVEAFLKTNKQKKKPHVDQVFFPFSALAKLKCATVSPPADESRRKHGSMRSLIYIDMDSAMTWCLLREILVFCHQMFSFFLFLLDSVICRKMEKYLPLPPHLQLKLNEPLSQSARVQQQH